MAKQGLWLPNGACPLDPGRGLALAEARESAKLPIKTGPRSKGGRSARAALEQGSSRHSELVLVASLGSQ